MKIWCLIFSVLILFSSCMSVPTANTIGRERQESESVTFTVRIVPQNVREDAINYAINEFVKSRGFESYDFNRASNLMVGFFNKGYAYVVTMPGSIPVRDMPELKIFDQDKTLALLVAPLGVGLVLSTIYIISLGIN